MFFTEPIYDLDELCKQNMHIHTTFSGCAKPDMEITAILREADRCGLEMIAITDHVQEMDDIHPQNNAILYEAVAKYNPKCKVYIGGEYSLYGIGKYTLKDSPFKPDFCLYSQNHYHCNGWEHPEEKTPEGYKEHAKACLGSIFDDRAADSIAHPLYGGYLGRLLKTEPYIGQGIEIFGAAWSDRELGDIMEKGFKSECAWELNVGVVLRDPALFRRYFQVGKEIGVVFTLGTDAHQIVHIDPRTSLTELKEILYR